MSKGISEIKRYIGEGNRRVLEFIDIQTGKKEYQGSTVIIHGMKLPTGEVVEQQVPIDFPIEAVDIEAAFRNFDKTANEVKSNLQKEADSRIIKGSKVDLDNLDNLGKNNKIQVVK